MKAEKDNSVTRVGVFSSDSATIEKSYHGIAARLDRLPGEGSSWHNKLAIILGTVVFCDCFLQYVGGSMLTSLLSSGWSTVNLNSICISLTMAGYAIGSLLTGFVSDRFGRRKGLLLDIFIFAAAALAAAFSLNMEVLIACRMIMGIGLGGALVACYGSLSEYTPPKNRGHYSGLIGLLGNFSPPLGALFATLFLPVFGWRSFYIGMGLLSILVFFWVYKTFPESPRWLALKGHNDKADVIVQQVEKRYLSSGIELKEINLREVKDKTQSAVSLKKASWLSLFRGEMAKRTLSICCALFAMNMLVYTITDWTPTLFVLKGLDASLSIAIAAVLLLGAPFGILLLVMFADKHGRKKGLIICLVVLAVLSIVWAFVPVNNVVIVILLGFVLCAVLYYYSLLACSVYIGELFPTEIRLRGVGFANAFGRIGSIISPVIVSFLLETTGIGSIFLFCGFVCVAAAVVIGVCGVETRYRSLEDINDHIKEGV